MIFRPNQRILFQGDSITDAGRNRSLPDSMGSGYAMMAAAWISALAPASQLEFLNRGISGNRAADLMLRWDEDCIALKPDWVSILIGVNDTWRRFDSGDETTAEKFEASYREILERSRDALGCKFILCEPFVLPHPADRLEWRDDIELKIRVVRKLAIEFGAIYVPFDGAFAAACTQRPPAFWAADGVHPTPAGHALMAQAWLAAVGAAAG